MVNERHSCQRLRHHHTDGEQAQEAVPRGEVGFTVQVFVVGDGSQAQDCTGHTEALQDPVDTAFGLVWQLFDGGGMR